MPKITPRTPGELTNKTWVTPADRMISNLDGKYWRISEVAADLGVSQSTLRRLAAKGAVKAPSYIVRQGGMSMYLYTEDDLHELKDYFKNKLEPRVESAG